MEKVVLILTASETLLENNALVLRIAVARLTPLKAAEELIEEEEEEEEKEAAAAAAIKKASTASRLCPTAFGSFSLLR
jgi:hypothetical protein